MIPKSPKIAKKSSKRQAFSGPKKHHETKKPNGATHKHFYDYEKSSPADCAKSDTEGLQKIKKRFQMCICWGTWPGGLREALSIRNLTFQHVLLFQKFMKHTLEPTCLDTLEHACLHIFEKTCQTHPQREAAEGRPPLWHPLCMALAGVQASGIKHQASSLKPQASSSKHQAANIEHSEIWALDSGKKLRNLAFPDSLFLMTGFLLG